MAYPDLLLGGPWALRSPQQSPKTLASTVTSIAQVVEHRPRNQQVASSIPGQGTCLGCGPGPWLGCVRQATHRCFSLSSMFLSLSPPLSKRKYIKLPGLGTPGGSGYQAQSKRRGPTLCPPSKPCHQAAGEGTMGGTPADRFSKGQRAHGTLHRAHFHYIFQGNSARLATGYWLLIKERCGCQPEAVL